MDVKLHLVKGNPKGKTVDVPTGTLVVGRAEDSDLIIASTRVSRKHCEITNDGAKVTVSDKGSANGTLVNGERVDSAALKAGDEVEIGPLTFRVEIAAAPQAKPQPKPQPAPAPQPKPPAPEPAAQPPKPAAPKPQRPTAPKPAQPPAPKPTQPAAPKPATPGKKSPDDIFGALDRMSKQRKQQARKDEDVLKLSDDDLLEDESQK